MSGPARAGDAVVVGAGGAVRSAELARGCVTDLFSSFHPMTGRR